MSTPKVHLEFMRKPFTIQNVLENLYKDVSALNITQDPGNIKIFVKAIEDIKDKFNMENLKAAQKWFKPRKEAYDKFINSLKEIDDTLSDSEKAKYGDLIQNIQMAYKMGGIYGFNDFIGRNKSDIDELQQVMNRNRIFGTWTLSPIDPKIFQSPPPDILKAIYKLMGVSEQDLKNIHKTPDLVLATKGRGTGDALFAGILLQYLDELSKHITNLTLPGLVALVPKGTISKAIQSYAEQLRDQEKEALQRQSEEQKRQADNAERQRQIQSAISASQAAIQKAPSMTATPTVSEPPKASQQVAPHPIEGLLINLKPIPIVRLTEDEAEEETEFQYPIKNQYAEWLAVAQEAQQLSAAPKPTKPDPRERDVEFLQNVMKLVAEQNKKSLTGEQSAGIIFGALTLLEKTLSKEKQGIETSALLDYIRHIKDNNEKAFQNFQRPEQLEAANKLLEAFVLDQKNIDFFKDFIWKGKDYQSLAYLEAILGKEQTRARPQVVTFMKHEIPATMTTPTPSPPTPPTKDNGKKKSGVGPRKKF